MANWIYNYLGRTQPIYLEVGSSVRGIHFKGLRPQYIALSKQDLIQLDKQYHISSDTASKWVHNLVIALKDKVGDD
jgi:hypothetical protein